MHSGTEFHVAQSTRGMSAIKEYRQYMPTGVFTVHSRRSGNSQVVYKCFSRSLVIAYANTKELHLNYMFVKIVVQQAFHSERLSQH